MSFKKLLLIFLLFSFSIDLQRFDTFGEDKSQETVYNICQKASNHSFPSYNKSASTFLNSTNYKERLNKKFISLPFISEDFITIELSTIPQYKEGRIFSLTEIFLFNKGVFLICAIWVIIFICFIFDKCLFSPKKISTDDDVNNINYNLKEEIYNKKCGINNILSGILFSTVIILSIKSYVTNENLYGDINATSCSLVRFLESIKFGKGGLNRELDFNQEYKWPGLLNLASILLESSNIITKISKEKEDVFLGMDRLLSNITDYKISIQKFPELLENSGLLNNFTLNNKNVQPLYICQYENATKKFSKLYLINEEFIKQINESIIHLSEIRKSTDNLGFEEKNFIKSINDIFDKLDEYASPIKDSTNILTTNVIFIHEKFLDKFYFSINYIYLLNIGISIFVLFFLIFSNPDKSCLIRTIINILWNFGIIIILLSEILFYFLFVMSNYYLNIIDLIHYKVLDVDNNLFLDSCLNKNDSINYILTKNETQSIHGLDEFYHLFEKEVQLAKPIIASYEIKKQRNEIEKYLEDFSITNTNAEKLMKELSVITGHKWVSDKKFCNDTHYLPIQKIKLKEFELNEKKCLVIKDKYTENEISLLFGDKYKGKIDGLYAIISKVNNLTDYSFKNEKLLKFIDDQLILLDNTNLFLVYEMNNLLIKAKKLLLQYTSIYKYRIAKNDTVFSLFKCNDLKNELISFYDLIFNHTYYNLKNSSIYNLIICVLTILGVLFLIKWIASFNLKDEKEIRKSMNSIEDNEQPKELEEIFEENEMPSEIEEKDEKEERTEEE